MHISEQRPESHSGAHSDYVREIPKVILELPKEYGRDIDLMIEARADENAVLFLREKYGSKVD
jgi:UV DNA damage repair endonuclease